MNLKTRKISTGSLFALVTFCLTACQGSNFGSSLEGAIAPDIPSNSEIIVEKTNKPTPNSKPTVPTQVVTATPTPETSVVSQTGSLSNSADFSKNDRSVEQITDVALQSLLKTPKKITTEKHSLKTLFNINFGNSQPQTGEFSDLETVPTPLRPWIKDLNKLGTITPKTEQLFQPNILVARREYARWLLQTNNRLYKNQPSRQIRLAPTSDTASFSDIPNNHPDFAIIQGLANAGLIGAGDRFRPNDPLLREELVQWKIPLDLRQPLPSATVETISQSWGFKDSDRISESALSSVFADSQLRDLSNIRRSFGFTTILQPQKPVTRAEAAASLWYFGTATDGLSVAKILELAK